MYHKIIGGKKSKGQRNINKSIEYLLREKNPEQQKDIKIFSTTTKQDLINFENYFWEINFKFRENMTLLCCFFYQLKNKLKYFE